MEIGLTLGLLAVALVLFVGEWIRYDVVALLVLLVLNLSGILTLEESFAGFSNPAVITVGAVLVMSRAVQNAGVIQLLGSKVIALGQTPGRLIFLIMVGVGAISGFINDVGAAALLLPVVLMIARRSDIAPSKLLIPLAFGCLLGGTLTMIGTPPNLLITQIMEQRGIEPFGMFDFTPIGLLVLICGILYMTFVGQHLLPVRRGEANLMERFKINDYLVETRIEKGSPLAGSTLDQACIDDLEFNILGRIRDERTVLALRPKQRLREGDLLLISVAPESLADLTHRGGLEVVVDPGLGESNLSSQDEGVDLVEAVVMPDSSSAGRSLLELNLRRRFGLTVMAISRHGEALVRRLASLRLQAGDTLLIQGDRQNIDTNLPEIGCLPLANREIKIKHGGSVFLVLGIFLIAVILASVGILHVAVAFTLGAFAMIATRSLGLADAYGAVEWPILILMAAMIPLGTALENTGTATWVATSIVEVSNSSNPHVLLALLFSVVSALTMVLNNPTVAVITAPIAIDMATAVNVSPRPFLMVTAIAASCAFLAPVSHKANVLVWGPGGYRFFDYTKVGFPLVVLIGVVCVLVVPVLFPLVIQGPELTPDRRASAPRYRSRPRPWRGGRGPVL